MKKTKKLVKQALKNPNLYTGEELAYFKLYLHEKKRIKKVHKKQKELPST